MDGTSLFFLGFALFLISIIALHFAGKERSKATQITNLNDNNDGIFHHRALHHNKWISEIKIDTNEETVYLSDGKRSKTYPFEHIKSWSYEIEGMTLNRGIGITGTMMANHINALNAENRENNSGFFVLTTDLKDPEWHIYFYSKYSGKSDKYAKDMKSQLLTWMNVFDHVFNGKIATK